MDLIGPISTVTANGDRLAVTTSNGKRYALIIVDEYSSFVHIYLLKQKSDAKMEIMNLIRLIKNQHKISVKGIHSDRGGEFLNDVLKIYYSSEGIIHTTSPAHRQHLNGKAEATNKSVVNTARCYLIESGAPVQLWGDALLAVGYVRNRTSLAALNGGVSPYELIYKTKPDLSRLRVWGANAFVYVEKAQRGKFDPIRKSGMFIGYDEQQYAYRILLLQENIIIISKDMTILEESFTNMNEYANMYPISDSNDTVFHHVPTTTSTVNFHTYTINGKDIDDINYPSNYDVSINNQNQLSSHLSKQINQSQHNQKQLSRLQSSTMSNGVSIIKTPETIIIDDNQTDIIGDPVHSTTVPFDSNVSEIDINNSNTISYDDQDLAEEHSPVSSPFSNHSISTINNNNNMKYDYENDESIDYTNEPNGNLTGDEYYEIKTSQQLFAEDLNSTDSSILDDSQSNSNSNFITSEQLQPVITAPTTTTTTTTRTLRAPRHATGFYNQNQSTYGNYAPMDRKHLETMFSITTEEEVIPETINQFEDLSMKSYKQMISRTDGPLWESATDNEFTSLIEQSVGTEIDPSTLSKGVSILPCRYVYAEKYNDLNEIVSRKARLVVRGDLQKDDSYNELFAPTGKSTSIKLIIAHAVQNDNELDQFDVSTAFLHAKVEEDVYIKLPDGCGIHTGKIWKLNKALYGLKQAPHAWNKEINQTLISLGYKPTYSDPCVYCKYVIKERIILYLYVDDSIIDYHISIKKIWLDDFNILKSKYKIKDLGPCNWILNMKLVRDRKAGTVTLSQEAYIKQILINSHMDISTTKSVDNPGDPSLYVELKDGDTPFPALTVTQHAYYRKVLGELLYAAIMTRMDIAHSVAYLSRFLSKPTMQHLNAVKRILRYLVGTAHYAMIFNAKFMPLDLPDRSINTTDFPILAYTDASWGNDLEDSKSTSATMIKFLGQLIAWLSKKQDCVANSSTESEYYALSLTISEVLWVQHWVEEVFNTLYTVLVLCDNQSAIYLSNTDSVHKKSKHIRIKYHFIRDYIRKGDIKVTWVQTLNQQADILTKCLSTKLFNNIVSQNLLTDSN